SPSMQPRLLPLHPGEAALSESDLFRVMAGGSCLLLGEPGAGKTTSMLALGGKFAASGPCTPVFVPLGGSRGHLLSALCQALSVNGEAVPRNVAENLISSGILILLLDGLNEVQDVELRRKLIEELNHLANPSEPTANSSWIVSSRVYDYEWARDELVYL